MWPVFGLIELSVVREGGGFLTVDSNPGLGTTVNFWFPAVGA